MTHTNFQIFLKIILAEMVEIIDSTFAIIFIIFDNIIDRKIWL